jgi:aminomethyltransferase
MAAAKSTRAAITRDGPVRELRARWFRVIVRSTSCWRARYVGSWACLRLPARARSRPRWRPASLRAVPATLRRTALYDAHVAAGAKMVGFAGWEMPVQYEGVRAEHLAVREACGIFDVSHMGEIEVSGPQALELLQRLLSNDVAKIAVELDGGGAQYSVLCREDGGVLDDLFTYRLDADRYVTVTNAANHARDLQWFQAHAEDFPEARVMDRLDDYAMLAVQGPVARGIVQAISDVPLPARMTAARRRLAGADVLVCGTGYTGEDGVELLCAPEHAAALWEEIVRRGAVPAGLAARDTLRVEVCFHLYGNDLSIERGPIEAGLGWCCREETDFIGAPAVRRIRESGPREKLVAFAIDGPGIARQGNPVVGGGEVTSGTLSPSLGVGIGLAYVPAERAAIGSSLEIDVRGKMRPATVREKPLYRKGS